MPDLSFHAGAPQAQRLPSLVRDFNIIAKVIFLTMLVFAGWLTWKIYALHEQRIGERLETTADRIERTVGDRVDYIDYIMDFIGRQISQSGADDLPKVANLLGSFKGNS
ncbi:MAG: hypothetical protein J0L97_11035, partial [Alphaproteobacteria bacterium]|nr:hypothetical protein [Alphaproteobacteria bacterium]